MQCRSYKNKAVYYYNALNGYDSPAAGKAALLRRIFRFLPSPRGVMKIERTAKCLFVNYKYIIDFPFIIKAKIYIILQKL